MRKVLKYQGLEISVDDYCYPGSACIASVSLEDIAHVIAEKRGVDVQDVLDEWARNPAEAEEKLREAFRLILKAVEYTMEDWYWPAIESAVEEAGLTD